MQTELSVLILLFGLSLRWYWRRRQKARAAYRRIYAEAWREIFGHDPPHNPF